MNYTLNKRDATEPAIIDAARAIGAYVKKMPPGTGWDITIIYNGVIFLGEEKSEGGRLTKNEKAVKAAIEAAGGTYYIWYTPDDMLDDVVGIVA